MIEISELLGYEKYKIVQDTNYFKFSIDSVLLGHFVDTKHKKNIIELGCGNGPVLMYLTLKTKERITGVELQKEVFDLCEKSLEINNLNDKITLINDNLKDIYKKLGNNKYDCVISNPPFFKYEASSLINENRVKSIARHEIEATLDDIVKEARRLLCEGGSLFMVHRTNRLADLLNVLNKYSFGVKKIRFVYSKANSDDSLMFLIEAKANKKDDCKVLKPLYIYDDSNNYTKEVLDIFNYKEE